eukprot:2473270-Rhodomonas_salina.1
MIAAYNYSLGELPCLLPLHMRWTRRALTGVGRVRACDGSGDRGAAVLPRAARQVPEEVGQVARAGAARALCALPRLQLLAPHAHLPARDPRRDARRTCVLLAQRISADLLCLSRRSCCPDVQVAVRGCCARMCAVWF